MMARKIVTIRRRKALFGGCTISLERKISRSFTTTNFILFFARHGATIPSEFVAAMEAERMQNEWEEGILFSRADYARFRIRPKSVDEEFRMETRNKSSCEIVGE